MIKWAISMTLVVTNKPEEVSMTHATEEHGVLRDFNRMINSKYPYYQKKTVRRIKHTKSVVN